MRGRGKEVIQLGFPIVDAPLIHDDSVVNHSKGPEVEPIPAQLQAVIHRLLDLQVLTSKPDACVIDVYNEGEYSQPHIHPPWYGRPLCVMFLSECDFTFGKIIWSDRSGHYNGSTKLSFAPGNLISMEGQAADFANHAIDATNKERILVTFTKSQPVKPRPMVSRPKNHGHWHIPSNGVMPASYIPSYHPNLMSGYVFQPAGFVYPNPCLVPQSGHIIPWHEPRHPIPGTGVFFPTNSEPDDKSRNSTSEHHDNKSKNLSNDDDDELHTITAGPEIARSGSDSK
ncbi:PREDICTED: uncharacterized protein LOC104822175 [Tarenaya hassleriana]|uniref:uncharacterized protein LOC104822175 n=1 Tax=Tarenaya hassleriana TaxID=28532 RepID=UPI00053C3DB4|nr:PREDICTED: uncharacterized protein LOC104822175 [Tarenaya hassleriana]